MPAGASRSPGPRAPERPRSCGCAPASRGPTAGGWPSAGRSGPTPSAAYRPAGAAALRLPVPGLRALPAPERVAERRLRARWRAAARRAERGRRRCSSASACGPGRVAARRALRRRAPARGARANAGACAQGAAAGRAARRRSTPARGPRPRELGAALREAGVPALLVTHDFSEAALLGDEVAVIDRGRLVQRGPPRELASQPASAFVADFLGASVLVGTRAGPGARASPCWRSTAADRSPAQTPRSGRAAASVFPWEVTLEPPGTADHGSAQNRLHGTVVSVTPVGNRFRVALATPQPLAAEVTEAALDRLPLHVGDRVDACWKATATRLSAI